MHANLFLKDQYCFFCIEGALALRSQSTNGFADDLKKNFAWHFVDLFQAYGQTSALVEVQPPKPHSQPHKTSQGQKKTNAVKQGTTQQAAPKPVRTNPKPGKGSSFVELQPPKPHSQPHKTNQGQKKTSAVKQGTTQQAAPKPVRTNPKPGQGSSFVELQPPKPHSQPHKTNQGQKKASAVKQGTTQQAAPKPVRTNPKPGQGSSFVQGGSSDDLDIEEINELQKRCPGAKYVIQKEEEFNALREENSYQQGVKKAENARRAEDRKALEQEEKEKTEKMQKQRDAEETKRQKEADEVEDLRQKAAEAEKVRQQLQGNFDGLVINWNKKVVETEGKKEEANTMVGVNTKRVSDQRTVDIQYAGRRFVEKYNERPDRYIDGGMYFFWC